MGRLWAAAVTAFAVVALAACGGGGAGNDAGAQNSSPVPVVQVPQQVALGATVTLDASGSTDAEDAVLTYQWALVSRPAGSAAALDSADSPQPHFVPDAGGNYVFTVTVSDGQSATAATVTVTANAGNLAPTAQAGSAQNVAVGALVRLDGTRSSDPNRNALTYAWTLTNVPSGSSAQLLNPTSATPTFTADVAGSYTAALVVNDGLVNSAPATVSIVALTGNLPPTADAGVPQSVTRGTLVQLSGANSSDPEGSALAFSWTLASRPSGSSARLAGATTVAPTFSADQPGTYVASLVVSDGQASSTAATVTITASGFNAPPVANAGPAQSVAVLSLVSLDGSASSDANGDGLSYGWTLSTRPTGSSATLSGADTVAPSFRTDVAGTYVATLVVNDGKVSSNPATVTIVAAAGNTPPVAHAGNAQSVLTGSSVTLDGSASSDSDGDTLTYAWTLTARPTGSSATLAGANTAQPVFTADVAGSYVAALVVSDGQAGSAAATVTVTATTGNAPPVANAGVGLNVYTGDLTTLNGSASYDANGDTLSYHWTLATRPGGSSAALSGATTVAPTFTPDVDGIYVATLVVSDGQANSNTATLTIRATPHSALPVEELMTTAAFGDVEFDWGRDGTYCGTCNFGAGNARFNWVDRDLNLWVANIDPDTGAISPANGRGVLVDRNVVYYTTYGNGPEWVFSQLGSELIYSRWEDDYVVPPSNKDVDDTKVGIGLAVQTGASTWSAGFIDGLRSRNSPAPTQTLSDPTPLTTYASSTSLGFFWRSLAQPAGPEVKPGFNSQGLAVRWVPGTGQFVYADADESCYREPDTCPPPLPIPNPPDPKGTNFQQIYRYDTTVGDLSLELLTCDLTQKRGAFLFRAPEFGNEEILITVASRTEMRIYRKTTTPQPCASKNFSFTYWVVAQRIYSPDPTQQFIATPEPFTFNGRTYAFFTISSSNSASDVNIPTDLALVSLDGTASTVRQLTDNRTAQRLRQDPEYFITRQGAFVYYSRAFNGTETSGPVHEGWYRVNAGLGRPNP